MYIYICRQICKDICKDIYLYVYKYTHIYRDSYLIGSVSLENRDRYTWSNSLIHSQGHTLSWQLDLGYPDPQAWALFCSPNETFSETCDGERAKHQRARSASFIPFQVHPFILCRSKEVHVEVVWFHVSELQPQREGGTFPLILISLRFCTILVINFGEHCQAIQSPGGQ